MNILLFRSFVLISMVATLTGLSYLIFEDSGSTDRVKVNLDNNISVSQRQNVLDRLSKLDLGNVSLGEVKLDLEKLDWIKSVTIKRVWPDELDIEVSLQIPLAYWNEDAYINSSGQIFESTYIEPLRLPHLYGPEGQAEEVMSQYQKLNMAMSGNGLKINVLQLDDRGVWRFTEGSGVEVLLGKNSISQRLRRFLRVYAEVESKTQSSLVKRIDTRYSNGVAVSWKESGQEYEIAKTYQEGSVSRW